MRNKILFTALLVIVLCVSCNSERNLEWFKEAVSGINPDDPNEHSSYFELMAGEEEGTIVPKDWEDLPKNLYIPIEVDGVTVRKVLDCSESCVEYVTVPSGVKVGANCFSECLNLGTVVLSGGVVEVAPGAFADCPSLQRVVVNCSYGVVSSAAFSTSCTADFEYAFHTYHGYNAFFVGFSHE